LKCVVPAIRAPFVLIARVEDQVHQLMGDALAGISDIIDPIDRDVSAASSFP
jgi:hypothetical protein